MSSKDLQESRSCFQSFSVRHKVHCHDRGCAAHAHGDSRARVKVVKKEKLILMAINMEEVHSHPDEGCGDGDDGYGDERRQQRSAIV